MVKEYDPEIEAIADALYRLEYGAAGGLVTEKEWAINQGLNWPTVTVKIYYTQATVAFKALQAYYNKR